MPKPIVKPEYKTAAFTKEEVAKRIKLGAKIYKDIDGTKGAVVNYQSRDIISYTWDDFTNLVLYEKEHKLAHHYSAMIAINLLKKNIYIHQIKFLNGAEKDVSIGTVQECISEYMDELYMLCLKRINTWDATIGVYFDQYIKMDIHSLAEQVGSFNQYGTGRSARLDAENRAKEPAIPYYEKLIVKDKTVVDSDKHPRMAPSRQKKGWHFIPSDLNTRPAEDLYILKHEESDDPDNPYLKDKRIKSYVTALLQKIDDIEFLKDAEKKAIEKAITAMYEVKENAPYSKEVIKSIVKTEQLLNRDIKRGPKEAINVGTQISSDSAIQCYLLKQKGLEKEEIAKQVDVNEKNVGPYIRNVERFIANMEAKDFGCPKEECLWYLGIHDSLLHARLANVLLRAGFTNINEFKGMSTANIAQIPGLTTHERIDKVVAFLEAHGINIERKEYTLPKQKSTSKDEKKTYILSEKMAIGQYCVEHNYDFCETAKKFQISFSQVLDFTQAYEAHTKSKIKDKNNRAEIDHDIL